MPRVATSLSALAALYTQEKNCEAALPLQTRVLAILEGAFGPNHPDLASSLIDYAALLRKMGRKKQASNLETRARNILSANPGAPQARLTIDVRELERPNSFLPAR